MADTNLSSFFSIIAGELDQVKRLISEQLVSSSESVNALLEHISGRGGKMLRPALVLLAGKSCGHTTQKHIDIAAMGNESAVLLGDFLLSKVFAMSARLQSPVITQVLSDTAVRMCHGELMQNTQRNNWQLTQAEYLDIVKDKTASLFSTCCYLGAVAAGGGQDQLCALSEYGLNLGTAFQITDDLLDITGDEGREGKTLGTDFAQCKPTLPIIHLLATAGSEGKFDLIEKLSGGDNPKQLAEMLKNAGSTEFARNMAQQLCKKATESLGVLGSGSAKDSLAEIADFVSRRSG
ncbi:MAG: polyprenyl synthetase family protein [Planctomycetota bacterium]